jgi:hypothetical protein
VPLELNLALAHLQGPRLYLIDLAKVTSVAEVHKILAHGVPEEEIDFSILATFVGSKVSQFLMCVVHDLIPDIEIIAMSSRGNVDAISIAFPFLIENFCKGGRSYQDIDP